MSSKMSFYRKTITRGKALLVKVSFREGLSFRAGLAPGQSPANAIKFSSFPPCRILSRSVNRTLRRWIRRGPGTCPSMAFGATAAMAQESRGRTGHFPVRCGARGGEVARRGGRRKEFAEEGKSRSVESPAGIAIPLPGDRKFRKRDVLDNNTFSSTGAFPIRHLNIARVLEIKLSIRAANFRPRDPFQVASIGINFATSGIPFNVFRPRRLRCGGNRRGQKRRKGSLSIVKLQSISLAEIGSRLQVF